MCERDESFYEKVWFDRTIQEIEPTLSQDIVDGDGQWFWL